MSDCRSHKKQVAGISDMKVLAEAIGDLHYEVLSDLLYRLTLKINMDAQKDLEADRFELSKRLENAAFCIRDAYIEIFAAWKISKPFMTKNKNHSIYSQLK